MSNKSSPTGAPDSWDQNEDNLKTDLTAQMSSLNVNASAFVPGQNIHAAAFVPSWLPQPAATAQSDPVPKLEPATDASPSPTAEQMDISPESGDASAPAAEKVTADSPPPDDWADSGSGESGEMDDEDDEDEDEEDDEITEEGASEATPKPKPPKKKRIRKPSEKELKKEHVNVVFIGHVDAGKSTIGGHLMYLTGMVDKRTLEKYEREAKDKNRESWYLSWALDTNIEERDKGKTVEVGRAYFETETKHFTILDAPGHRSFVPNMIGGASQADLAVLVISARKGEFETGFERGGQTREHAMLAKTAGVKHLVVIINKMDDPTVQWDENRYNVCKDKLLPYLRKCGFNPKTDIYFMPVSGLTGAFLKDHPEDKDIICPWYSGPSLIEYLDQLPALTRASSDGPLRMPIIDKYRDMGTVVLGKIESGKLTRTSNLIIMPNRQANIEVLGLTSDDYEKDTCYTGENVKVKLKGVDEEDISPGFVLCDPSGLCNTGKIFDAQIYILEHKSIICPGYSAVMHIHASVEEITITRLGAVLDKKTGDVMQKNPRFVKQDQVVIARLQCEVGAVCMEKFKDFPQMGRFTLRDEGRTVALGKVLKILE